MVEKLDSRMQKNETQPLSYAIHKVSPEWIKDLNARSETKKLLKK